MNKAQKEQAILKFRQHIDFWETHGIKYTEKEVEELKKDCELDGEILP